MDHHGSAGQDRTGVGPIGDYGPPGVTRDDVLRALESLVRFRVVDDAGCVGCVRPVTEVPRDIEAFGFVTGEESAIDPSSGFDRVQVLDGGSWRTLQERSHPHAKAAARRCQGILWLS